MLRTGFLGNAARAVASGSRCDTVAASLTALRNAAPRESIKPSTHEADKQSRKFQQLQRRCFSRSAASGLAASNSQLQAQFQGHLPGYPTSPYLTSLDSSFFDSVRANESQVHGPDGRPGTGIPTFRLMDGTGSLLEGVTDEALEITQEEAVKMYEKMLLLPAIDVILYNAQRQGRISFMMTSYGEEGAVIGSAAGLATTDEVFAQYRESGVLLWRGFPLDNLMSQVFGVHDDLNRARQMPCHYSSTELHFHTISSPLATQIPQAAGAGFALKRSKGREGDVAVCYFGEGAASEGDFHAGLNIAATTRSPVLFIVRNNGFAISTPSTEQYVGDGIASRGPGYGIPTIRVDGNDAFAVRAAVRGAKKRALANSTPVLIECMTYRVGHHSTSDDSSAYRSKKSVEDWKKMDNPLHRMRNFLTQRGWWSDAQEEETTKRYRAEVIAAMTKAEKKLRPTLSSMFEDTYTELPANLQEQRAELARLVKTYGKVEHWSKELQKHEEQGKDLEKFLTGDAK
ncbi:putative 2-oxoisovalerate dehydrogenase alpha subunit mitochondrial precursor [Tilletiaria anomala UBC 951]|uniref:2-oxoisovalerate dehydrogenase subunit alpha n=1 Tax=Tilletiaria anomala (strain ATCC 24038 / CBS 436.72 / UBC 951) TaxID=1037660 RepID=A0A066WQ46_TILAU|nr:putative 2-oxoisovalerate dehydrogenase alpha subunit mitochondrial precursor [Tilletiaria anomala UBC 951]KDN53129.1 putative 2-oxoisovalerate dehydrogenase alpha subunit mitochondrial precursor [Tilletiaria anomala UBC 951]